MLEKLSKFVHEEMWVKWTKGLMEEEIFTEERTKRWNSLHIPYEELSEEEKEKDRWFVKEIFKLIEEGTISQNEQYNIKIFPSSLKIPSR